MTLVESKIGRGQGPFRGVKLYPPLGYLPTHPALVPLFDYCERYDVPIIVHTSPGGIQNFRKHNHVASTESSASGLEDFAATNGNKSRYYANPSNWLPVLRTHPRLRLDFAHFGGGEQLQNGDTEWSDTILGLLADPQYPNLYADISYFAAAGLPDTVARVLRQHPHAADRMMFGTDYIMIMLDPALGGLQPYFDRFAGLDDRLLHENAARFLKLA
jgi:predicted TIM-barrel fold metal-dependent hydrolase